MLETLIADDDFPEDGDGVDSNAETVLMLPVEDADDGVGPKEVPPLKRDDAARRVLPGVIAARRLARLKLTPYMASHHPRVAPLQGMFDE